MHYKSIFTTWDGRESTRPALDLAIALTRANDGHLNLLCLGLDQVVTGLYYAGATPAALGESIETARRKAEELGRQAEDILGGEDINWSVRPVVAQSAGIPHVVGAMARFNDLALLPRPYGEARSEEAAMVLEAVLFDGHCPVMVAPQGNTPVPGRRIVIGWNESAEAMAAIRAALPLITAAESVDIAVIDPPRHDENQTDPGSELSRMLARHGARVTVSVLARTVPKLSEVLLRHAADTGADLIVMGAYGHSRFRESILGGATRDMLEETTLPVLMAH